MISSQQCCSGSQAPERSEPLLSELQTFLAMPRMLAALREAVLEQRNRQVVESEQIRELNRSVQAMADDLTGTQRTLDSLSGNLPAITGSIKHVASTNEQLGEQYFRRHIATPLGNAVLDLLGLIEQMTLESTDSDILCTALTDLLTVFFMELYEPVISDPFDSKTMTVVGPNVSAVGDGGTGAQVVSRVVRPGILFQADGDETMVIRHATVNVAAEDAALENHKPVIVLHDEEAPQLPGEAMEQMASTESDDDLFHNSRFGGER